MSWVGTRNVCVTLLSLICCANSIGLKFLLSANPIAAPMVKQGSMVMLTLELCGIWIR